MPFDQILSTSNPIAVRLMGYLDVLLTWATIFERLLDKFESKQYEKYNFFSRSDALASSMVAIIGLTANHNAVNQMHAQSIISISNLAKLD